MLPTKTAPAAKLEGERRIPALDGLRGAATIMVIVSHYFGELGHGLSFTMFGWIAVDIFFVLSGFLIGKLILEKQHHANFFTVFYARRFFRLIPAYLITIVVVDALIGWAPPAWGGGGHVLFPEWVYFTFLQGVFMTKTGSIGAHWLAPTWTLAVEEHFYLIVPALIVLTPRRLLPCVLIATALASVGLRIAIYFGGFANEMVSLVLLPGRADLLVFGVLGAVAVRSGGFALARIEPLMRWTLPVTLFAVSGLKLYDDRAFFVFNPVLLAIGSTAYLICIVRNLPEARRFQSRTLRFFGDNGYCLYLTHLPVLGLMHGLILGTEPDLVTPFQWMVTFATLPVCVLVGWGMTQLVEAPLTRYGRTWRWSAALRSPDPTL